MKKVLIVALCIVLALSLVGCGGGITQEEYDAVVAERDALLLELEEKSAPDNAFADVIQTLESSESPYYVIASDESYIEIDTNPTNTDDYYDPAAIELISEVNGAFGFPESLYQKMAATRSMDGRQTSENDACIVSWTYHPNQGLEVMYEKKS